MADAIVPRRATALIYVDRTKFGNFAAKWCIRSNLVDEPFRRWEKLEYLDRKGEVGSGL